MIDQPAVSTETIARPIGAASRQHGLVPPPPPSDDEKYLYIERNLFYLTTVIFIGSRCPIYSQIRLETHDLVLAPFLLFTAVYVIYQAISLPVNFTGRGFDLAAHRPGSGLAAAVLPDCGHLPADLRRADRLAPQHLDGRVRTHRRATRAVPGRSCWMTAPARRDPRGSRVFRLHLRAPARRRPSQEGRQPRATRSPTPAPSTSSSSTLTSRPRPDFLAETLPYMDDLATGIVQTRSTSG